MTALLWLLPALPAVVGAVLALAARRPRVRTATPAVSVVTAALVCVVAVVVAVGRPRVAVPFVAGGDLALGVDGLSAALVVAVGVVALLVVVFATGDAAEVGEAPGRFHGLVLLFVAAVLVTATATTLPALLLAWEVMGATSYALIGFDWVDGSRPAAGLSAFVTTRTADLGLYLAAGAALAGGSGLRLDELADASPGWRSVVAGGVVVAGLGKAAQLPFSSWLSGAMQGPSPVSALLHSAAMVAMGGYLLLRLSPLLHATGWAATTTAWAGALTALLMALVAVAQRDLKQLLAASTASQLGFVVLAAGVAAVPGGAAQLLTHAATKALLFLCAGAWLTALGTKRLSGLRGAARRWRVVGSTATVGLISLAGLPPLGLWVSKDAVLAATREESPALWLTGLGAAALSAAYAGRALVLLWAPLRTADTDVLDDELTGTRSVDRRQAGPLVVLAGLTVGGAALLVPSVLVALQRLVGGQRSGPSALELTGTALLALVVLGVVVVARDRVGPAPRLLREWWGLDALWRRGVVRPVDALARGLARFDDQVLDTGVDRAAAGTLRLARSAGRADLVAVDDTVERFAAGVRALGRLTRRPQTGQLHQYYLQAVVIVAVAVLVVIVVT